jgi:hypothetical protein
MGRFLFQTRLSAKTGGEDQEKRLMKARRRERD